MKLLETIVGTLRGRRETTRAVALGSYHDLVCGLADETLNESTFDPQRLEELLADAGKSIDDLKRDVEGRQGRKSMAAKVATLPELQDQLDAVRSAQAENQRQIEHHQAEASRLAVDVVLELQRKETAVIERIKQVTAVERRLIDDCPDPVLAAEKKAHDERGVELRRELKDVDKQLNDFHGDTVAGKLRLLSDRLAQATQAGASRNMCDRIQQEINELAPRLRRLQERQPQIVAELAQWVQRDAELREKMLAV